MGCTVDLGTAGLSSCSKHEQMKLCVTRWRETRQLGTASFDPKGFLSSDPWLLFARRASLLEPLSYILGMSRKLESFLPKWKDAPAVSAPAAVCSGFSLSLLFWVWRRSQCGWQEAVRVCLHGCDCGQRDRVCVVVPEHTEAAVLPLPMRPCLTSLVHRCRLPGGLKLGTPCGLPGDAHS